MNHFSIVVFASGRGRTLENLLQRIEDESLPLKVKALVLHRPCNAEQIAASHDLPVHHIDAEDRGIMPSPSQSTQPRSRGAGRMDTAVPLAHAGSRRQHPPLSPSQIRRSWHVWATCARSGCCSR